MATGDGGGGGRGRGHAPLAQVGASVPSSRVRDLPLSILMQQLRSRSRHTSVRSGACMMGGPSKKAAAVGSTPGSCLGRSRTQTTGSQSSNEPLTELFRGHVAAQGRTAPQHRWVSGRHHSQHTQWRVSHANAHLLARATPDTIPKRKLPMASTLSVVLLYLADRTWVDPQAGQGSAWTVVHALSPACAGARRQVGRLSHSGW